MLLHLNVLVLEDSDADLLAVRRILDRMETVRATVTGVKTVDDARAIHAGGGVRRRLHRL